VASHRFDSLAKTNFSLARVKMQTFVTVMWTKKSPRLVNPAPLRKWRCRKNSCLSQQWFTIFMNKILCPTLQCRSIHCKHRYRCYMYWYNYRCRPTTKTKVFATMQNAPPKNTSFIQNVDSRFLMSKMICSILILHVFTSCRHTGINIILALFNFRTTVNLLFYESAFMKHDPQSFAWFHA